ncbi:MAG: ComEC/Rec2 family competence protein [Lentisphaeria bacterium]
MREETENPQSNCRTCPAVPVVSGLIAGITAAFISHEFIFLHRIVILGLFVVVAWLLCKEVHLSLWNVATLPVAFALTAYHLHAPANTYADHLYRIPGSAQVRGVVVEATYSGDQIPWFESQRRYELQVQEIKGVGSNTWQKCGGDALLVTDGNQSLRYGSRIESRVTVVKPDAAMFLGEFDYRQYLLVKGIEHEFKARGKVEIERGVRGWRRLPALLYWARDRLVERLIKNVPTESNARMLAALVFGYKESLTPEVEYQFLRGGAIHLFAVSGLHIGIAAGLMFFVLRLFRVPYRWRYWILPLILGIYVFITGGAASAVRAWLMISVWAVSKARFRAASPLNAVSVAAIILLLWNPLKLLMSGFQFSFIIVSVLLLGWEIGERAKLAAVEKLYWQPAGMSLALRPWHAGRWTPGLINLSGVVVLAWLGSAGLVAFKNSMIVPAGILSNLFVSILAWAGLLTAMLKTAAAFLPTELLDVWLGQGLNLLMDAVRGTVAAAQEIAITKSVTRPPVTLIITYYAALFLALMPNRPLKFRGFAWGSACICLLFIAGPPSVNKPHAVIFKGNGTSCPVAVVAGPEQAHGAVVINAGNYQRARHLKAWLRTHGHDSIRMLVLHNHGWHAASGLNSLLQELRVETLVLYRSSRSEVLENLSKPARANLARVRYAQRVDGSGRGRGMRKLECGGVSVRFTTEDQRQITKVVFPSATGVSGLRISTVDTGAGRVRLQPGDEDAGITKHLWSSMQPRASELYVTP